MNLLPIAILAAMATAGFCGYILLLCLRLEFAYRRSDRERETVERE